jgi:hypothetical protein
MAVRRLPASEDRTQGQRDCRRSKQKDLKGYMSRLAELEKAVLAAKGQPSLPGEERGDVGTRRALADLHNVLRKANEHFEIGLRVMDAWDKLTDEGRQTILDLVGGGPLKGEPGEWCGNEVGGCQGLCRLDSITAGELVLVMSDGTRETWTRAPAD